VPDTFNALHLTREGDTDPAGDPDATDTDDVVRSFSELATRSAADWFSCFGGAPVATTLAELHVRPRCFVHRFTLTDGTSRRDVVLKIRHSDATLRRAERFDGRPELTPQRTISDRDSARCELTGLQQVARAMEGADPERFGVLRALAWLDGPAGIVMEYVDEPTLRQQLVRRWRRAPLRHGRPGRTEQRDEDRTWSDLGEWLRRFHAADDGRSLPARMSRRDELVDFVERARHFLLQAGAEPGVVSRLATTVVERAERVFPVELPTAAGHGDFTAQNVFVGSHGRITVFDPLPLWRVCVHEDLARLTMGVRLLGPQVLTHGRLLGEDLCDRWEARLLAAYADGGRPPADQLHVFQALLLMDRWGELLGKRPARGRARQVSRRVRVHVGSGWYERQAGRLSSLLG
jgi:hypothetical protein